MTVVQENSLTVVPAKLNKIEQEGIKDKEMKKLGLILALATVLTFGTTQANAEPGIVLADVAHPTRCDTGILIADWTGILIADWTGILITDFAANDCSNHQDTPPGILIVD